MALHEIAQRSVFKRSIAARSRDLRQTKLGFGLKLARLCREAPVQPLRSVRVPEALEANGRGSELRCSRLHALWISLGHVQIPLQRFAVATLST